MEKLASVHRAAATTLPSQTLARHKTWIFLGMTVLAFIVYLALATTNYDGNDLLEVRLIEQGDAELFAPNHLIYRPIIWLMYQAMQALGYSGLSILPAQIFIAFCGALGVGLFYLWFSQLVNDHAVALTTTLGFSTAWVYWYYSTTTIYIMPAATCTLGALVVFWPVLGMKEPQRPTSRLIGAGVISALSILFWQANVFFPPLIILALLVKYRRNLKQFLIASLVYGLSMTVIIGAGYVIASWIVLNTGWSIPAMINWATNYGGARLPIWGKLDSTRFVPAARSFVASIIPIWEGLGISSLMRGEIEVGKLLSLLSLPALGLLFLLPVFNYLRRRSVSPSTWQLLAGLLIGFLAYVPFILWWDPFEPRWFLIPAIALWAIIGVVWSATAYQNHLYQRIFAMLVIVIAVANLTATILPRRFNPNPAMIRAECIAQHMNEQDTYVALEWIIPDHLGYFYKHEVFSLLHAAGQKEGVPAAFDDLAERLETVSAAGGVLYIASPASITPDNLDWLRQYTNITVDDLSRIQTADGFTCDSTPYQVITNISQAAT
jgi:hypothetical protein